MNIRRIEGRHNPRYRTAVKLRTSKYRLRQQRFLIDGVREILLAQQQSIEILEVYCCPDLIDELSRREVMESLGRHDPPIFEIATSLWKGLAYGDRRDGWIAVAKAPSPLSSLPLSSREPLVVLLDRAEKPGNIGAVLRSADAVAADGVILVDGSRDLYNPNTIRASIGTVFHVPVWITTAEVAVPWLRQHAFQVFVTRVDAARSYLDVDLRGPTAIVLGSESHGVSDVWQDAAWETVHIPMCGIADSLNLSVSSAVLLYEAARQRRDLSIANK